MSSGKGTPFEDITNLQKQDPKDVKRQRNREYYARNKDEIAKRRRQTRELKKQTPALVIDDNTICHTPATSQSGATQLQYITHTGGIMRDVQHQEASKNFQPDSSHFHAGVDSTLGSSTVSLYQPSASAPQSGQCGPISNLTSSPANQIHRGQLHQKSQSWYARLSPEQKAEYIQKQHIARQQKKAANRIVVNCADVPHTSLGVYGVLPQTCTSQDTPGIGKCGSAVSVMTKDLTSRCSESLGEDDSDWLHSNLSSIPHARSVKEKQNESTSDHLHGQESFIKNCAVSEMKRQRDSSEKKRLRERERYSSMTVGHKEVLLHNKREYKKSASERGSSLATSHGTTVIQTQSYKNIQTCIVRDWDVVNKIFISFSSLMRAQTDPLFSSYLLRIGEGTEETIGGDYVRLPDDIVIPYAPTEEPVKKLIEDIFPSLHENAASGSYMSARAILSTKNEYVDSLNKKKIDRFPGQDKIYYSFDSVEDDARNNYTIDYLNSITPNGLPPHVLKLKVNCPVILLTNLDPHNGLCNGTRLMIREFQNNAIDAEIVGGQHAGNRVFIPRIPLSPSEDISLPFKFKRKQFPIRLSFAMTINKAQGQTIPNVGIYLPEPVFSHGQLYVALSRGVSRQTTRILAKPNKDIDPTGKSTKNIVYRDVLEG